MRGRREPLARLVASIVLTGGVALAAPTTGVAAASPGGPALVAYLGAEQIPLGTVASYHCHDRDYPVIRCFLTAADRAAEEAAPDAVSGNDTFLANLASLLSPYVRWYRDANYSGASFESYVYEADLASIGWDNQISSFTPLNGGHPLWWAGANRTGTKWDWGTAPMSTLGAANDQISSADKG